VNFDWRENGFETPPNLTSATGTECLYRAWGGHPGRKWGNTDLPGVCFSTDRAMARWEAELLYSVMEYHNPVQFLTLFTVFRGTPLWLGKVHPGDVRAVFGNMSGSQVLIERQYIPLVKETVTTPLIDDLGSSAVYTGKRPRVSS
jgi:hypothetical protein